jgi:hypothetical protein
MEPNVSRYLVFIEYTVSLNISSQAVNKPDSQLISQGANQSKSYSASHSQEIN